MSDTASAPRKTTFTEPRFFKNVGKDARELDGPKEEAARNLTDPSTGELIKFGPGEFRELPEHLHVHHIPWLKRCDAKGRLLDSDG